MTARLFALALALAAPALARPDAEPADKLDTAIANGIKLLEGKKHAEFLKAMLSAEDLKMFGGDTLDEKRVKEFGEEHAPRVLEAFKAIKGKKPTMEDDGSLAVFKLKKEVVKGMDKIRFRKVEKKWTLLNN